MTGVGHWRHDFAGDRARELVAHRALESSLSEARQAAEEAARVKADFMANMSHEIRTPLTAILGFAGLLVARDDLSGGARHQISRIASAGQALLAIVNDILDFSKLEAGEVTLRSRPVRPTEIFSDALDLFQPQAEAKEIELHLEVGALPPWLSLDPDKLRQVLVNLIGNAVKFTQTGSVTLAARHSEPDRLEVEVRDTGCGMSAQERDKIFQRFSQIDGSLARAQKGTGLGLAISRALAEVMGGEIGVTSQPGEGSVFRVSIKAPMVAAPAVGPDHSDSAIAIDLRILVADDNASNRELVRAVLEALGAEVTEAADGAAALEAASALPFDVILMDVRMPDIDGVAAARHIRGVPGPNQTVPILAFTADAQTPAVSSAGPFDGVVRKPIVPTELLQALAESLQYPESESEVAGHAVAR
jgi:CheY-like chemotaxis protein